MADEEPKPKVPPRKKPRLKMLKPLVKELEPRIKTISTRQPRS